MREVIGADEDGRLFAVPVERAQELAAWLDYMKRLRLQGMPDEHEEIVRASYTGPDFSGFEVELVPVCYEVKRVREDEG